MASARCCRGKNLCYKNGRLFLHPWELSRRDTCTVLTHRLIHAAQSVYHNLFLPRFPFAQASVVGEETGNVSFYTVYASCVNYVGEPCLKSGVANVGYKTEVTKTVVRAVVQCILPIPARPFQCRQQVRNSVAEVTERE